MEAVSKPVPQDVELSRPYWQAAARGELVLQRCADCGKIRHYPRLLCDACYSRRSDYVAASGLGRRHSWTITCPVLHKAFAAEVPYALVTVDLAEGVRALGRWDGGELSIGLSVQAYFNLTEVTPELRFRAA